MKTFCAVTLGCDKNRTDTEKVLATLVQAGYLLVEDPAAAAVVLINTCGFIQAARTELEQTLQRLKRSAVILLGCALPLLDDTFFKKHPQVIGTVAPRDYGRIVALLRAPRCTAHLPPSSAPEATTTRLLSTTPHAYLKIADGCNHGCAYCLIPALRGRYRSRPFRTILREARELVASGVREIVLVAQDTSLYGTDRYRHWRLWHLLKALEKIRGQFKIRLLYSYLDGLEDRVLSLIGQSKKICHYLDIPLQHTSEKILKSMRRPWSRTQLERQLARVYQAIPEVALRTTVIAGYPGETAADWQDLLTFFKQHPFRHVGHFIYSPEPGTAAAQLPMTVAAATAEQRTRQLDRYQQQAFTHWAKARVGEIVMVLVTEVLEQGWATGRNDWFAPEVDGQLILRGKNWHIGQWRRVQIIGSEGHNLVGRSIDG